MSNKIIIFQEQNVWIELLKSRQVPARFIQFIGMKRGMMSFVYFQREKSFFFVKQGGFPVFFFTPLTCIELIEFAIILSCLF